MIQRAASVLGPGVSRTWWRLFVRARAAQDPATATGAFISGLREAQRIDEAVRAGFARPEPPAAPKQE